MFKNIEIDPIILFCLLGFFICFQHRPALCTWHPPWVFPWICFYEMTPLCSSLDWPEGTGEVAPDRGGGLGPLVLWRPLGPHVLHRLGGGGTVAEEAQEDQEQEEVEFHGSNQLRRGRVRWSDWLLLAQWSHWISSDQAHSPVWYPYFANQYIIVIHDIYI